MTQVQTDVETPAPEAERYASQHSKVLRFEISVGNDDDAKTLEQFEEDLRAALAFARDHGSSVYTDAARSLNFHNLTVQGGYYIIDGKVCLARDYDPATKNRKPGTFPPQWAGGPDPRKIQQQLPVVADDEEEDDGPREFVHVKPTKSREFNPMTGRRVRSDKGKPRGPRKDKTPEEKAAANAAIDKLRQSAGKESA